MTPRPLRSLVLAGALACAGCAPPAVRTFAVVLEEPEYLDCIPRIETPDVSSDQLAQLYSSITTDWRGRWDAGFLRPAGGSLLLVAHGEGMQAWLDDLNQSQYVFWNGVVFEGDPHDGYVELANIVSHDTKTEDCGQLIDARSELYGTLDGGQLDGRIRRTEYSYFWSPSSLCGAYVECVRNIAVSGTEE